MGADLDIHKRSKQSAGSTHIENLQIIQDDLKGER